MGRAVGLVLLSACSGTLFLFLVQRPEVSQWLQRVGVSIGYEGRLFTAALLTALAGLALAALLFGGAERTVREALVGLDGAETRTDGQEGLRALTGALHEWRLRARAAEASRERLASAARTLAEALEAVASEIDGTRLERKDGAGSHRPAEYEDEALRRLAAAAEETSDAARRVRQVMVALLARVAEDLARVNAPLGPVQETMAGMARVVEDLVATHPTMSSVAALQAALADCSADVSRAREAAGLVERELNAVRRRFGGGAPERLASRDLSPRDDAYHPEGKD